MQDAKKALFCAAVPLGTGAARSSRGLLLDDPQALKHTVNAKRPDIARVVMIMSAVFEFFVTVRPYGVMAREDRGLSQAKNCDKCSQIQRYCYYDVCSQQTTHVSIPNQNFLALEVYSRR